MRMRNHRQQQKGQRTKLQERIWPTHGFNLVNWIFLDKESLQLVEEREGESLGISLVTDCQIGDAVHIVNAA